jgi:hypothetical protein
MQYHFPLHINHNIDAKNSRKARIRPYLFEQKMKLLWIEPQLNLMSISAFCIMESTEVGSGEGR